MDGWIKLHRQIMENEFYFSERFSKGQAWIDLLLLANHKSSTIFIRGNEVKLERGQLGYAITTLAERWQWNERTVDKYLLMLQNREMIHYRKNHITTVITILNYDNYQNATEQNAEQNAEQSKNRIQTNKNDKKEKNDKNPVDKLFNIIPDGLNTPDFIEVWKRWIIFRKEIKKKLTESTAKVQLKFLLEQNNPIEVIEKSIRNSWQGLFELKNNNGNGKDYPPQTTNKSESSWRFTNEQEN